MLLPDWKIEEMCQPEKSELELRYPLITPFSKDQLQPASYDLKLYNQFRKQERRTMYSDRVIDPFSNNDTDMVVVSEIEMVIKPGEFMLASTVERFRFPNNVAGQIGGKSSLARLGLQVHATAGFFDPGFIGDATLELLNTASMPIRLYPGMLIAQMIFLRLEEPSSRVYGEPGLNSHYLHQRGPTPSLYHQQTERGLGQ